MLTEHKAVGCYVLNRDTCVLCLMCFLAELVAYFAVIMSSVRMHMVILVAC